jgi:DNA polymerase-1
MIGFDTSAEGGSLRWLTDYQRVLVNAFVDIEATGFPFDHMQHKKFVVDAQKVHDEYEEKLRAAPELMKYVAHHGIPLEGKERFNLGSAAQLSNFLFGIQTDKGLALEPFKLSKTTSKPSTDKESLQHYASEGVQFCDDLLVLRNFQKLLSSFGEPLFKYYSPITGCVHPNYFLAKVVDGTGLAGGTSTGRLSCKNPNMQQLPKRDKDDRGIGLAGSDVRRSFVPLPGHILFELDQSQVEVRVAGMYAKDVKMGEFFKAGGDFHCRVAAAIFHQDYAKMQEVLGDKTSKDTPAFKQFKAMRSAAKTFTFGIMFGMGMRKLTRQAGLSEDEGEEFVKNYFKTFPQFARWREGTIYMAEETGIVTTLFGRKRSITVKGYASDDGRESRIGVNTPVQSAAADITLFGIARVWEWLVKNNFKTKIIGTIHDSIIFSVPPTEVNEVIPAVTLLMERPPGLEWLLDDNPVPLSVGADIGPNFCDMVELPRDVVLAGEINYESYLT